MEYIIEGICKGEPQKMWMPTGAKREQNGYRAKVDCRNHNKLTNQVIVSTMGQTKKSEQQ